MALREIEHKMKKKYALFRDHEFIKLLDAHNCLRMKSARKLAFHLTNQYN